MHGQSLEKKVTKWFDFSVPSPSIPRDFVERQLDLYEIQNQKRVALLTSENVANLYWLGGKLVRAGNEYHWVYLMEEQAIQLSSLKHLDINSLMALSPETSEGIRAEAISKLTQNENQLSTLKKLFGRGLVIVD